MNESFAAHNRQRERMLKVVNGVSSQLQEVTVRLACEMIQANEFPVALDLLSEMLVKSAVAISSETHREFRELSEGFGLDLSTWMRLGPLVHA